jgi:endonuclease III
VTKKSEHVVKLLDRIQPRWELPAHAKELDLLEHGLLVVLMRHMPRKEQKRAEEFVLSLKKSYADWNEMRVAQVQEIAAQMLGKGRRAAPDDVEQWIPAARDLRDFLQEVFQKTHGLELEFLRQDLPAGSKLIQQMPHLGLAGGGFLLWIAGDKQLPVHSALVRVLDRLALVSRSALSKKARDSVAPLVPEGSELRFVQVLGEVADRWCDARRPICWECVLRDDCPFGKKVAHEHKIQMEKLAVQRKKEEARRAIVEKKLADKRRREEERAAKKAAVEDAKRERERQRKAGIEAKKRALEESKAKKKVEFAKKKAAIEKARAEAAKRAQKAKAKKAKSGKRR